MSLSRLKHAAQGGRTMLPTYLSGDTPCKETGCRSKGGSIVSNDESDTGGTIRSGSSSIAELPAEAVISTSTGGLNPPPEGTTLASPFTSVVAVD